MIKFKNELLCGAATCLLIATPAMGQEQTTDETGQQAGNESPAEAAERVDFSQEIVVTASRREQSLLEVPLQVTALTGSDLANRNLRSLDEFAGFIPGLSVQSSSPGVNLIAVRGVTTGAQPTNAVGIYLDDVAIGSSSGFAAGARALSINAFDLDRVEVLSGPQGTLYGASSLGGTVRYITARPQLDRGAARLEGELSQTNHGGTNSGGRGMINMPLIMDRVALRADVIHQYDTGFVDDPSLGLENQGSGSTLGARVSLRAELTPNLDVQLTGFTQRINVTGVNTVERNPVTGEPLPGAGPYEQNYRLPQRSNQKVQLAYGTVNWDAGFAELTSITSYQTGNISTFDDISTAYSGLFGTLFGFGAAGVNPYSAFTDISLKKFTQEARLVSEPGSFFDWVVGGYYTHEKASTFVTVENEADPRGFLLGALPIFTSTIPTRYRETAGYANGTFHFTPRLDLTLGIRYSHNEQSFTQTNVGLLSTPATPFATRVTAADSDENVTTYLINPSFKVTDDVTVYARAANGFRPGGPNYVLFDNSQNPTFDADTLWSYEVGAKASLLDRRLQGSIAVYQIDWSDIQLTANVSGLAQLVNAGDARIRGGDAAFGFRATDAFTINGSVAYTDAKLITTAPDLGITFEGARLPVSPRWSFAIGADYVIDLGGDRSARFSVTDRYQGTRFSGYVGSATQLPYKLDAFHIVDADLTFTLTPNLDLGVYAKNLLDSRGELVGNRIDNAFDPSAPANVALTRPRTVGVQARLRI